MRARLVAASVPPAGCGTGRRGVGGRMEAAAGAGETPRRRRRRRR